MQYQTLLLRLHFEGIHKYLEDLTQRLNEIGSLVVPTVHWKQGTAFERKIHNKAQEHEVETHSFSKHNTVTDHGKLFQTAGRVA